MKRSEAINKIKEYIIEDTRKCLIRDGFIPEDVNNYISDSDVDGDCTKQSVSLLNFLEKEIGMLPPIADFTHTYSKEDLAFLGGSMTSPGEDTIYRNKWEPETDDVPPCGTDYVNLNIPMASVKANIDELAPKVNSVDKYSELTKKNFKSKKGSCI